MKNKLASTRFKLNQTLLDYITGEGSKHNLLIDVDTEHKFADYFVALRCVVQRSRKKKINIHQVLLLHTIVKLYYKKLF